MGVFLTLVRRELGMTFKSPAGFIVVAVVLGLCGFTLVDMLEKLSGQEVDLPFVQLWYRTGYFWLILLMVSPAMTMRSFAAERSSGTYEALMTAPVSDAQVVWAKFGGAMLFYLLTWAPLLAVFAALRRITGEEAFLDPVQTAGAFLGLTLIGSLYMAMGVFASSLTRNQLVAAMISFLLGMGLWVASILPSTENAVDGRWAAVAEHISVVRHLEDFAAGILDSRPLVLYPTATLFFLFLTTRVVESRRWR